MIIKLPDNLKKIKTGKFLSLKEYGLDEVLANYKSQYDNISPLRIYCIDKSGSEVEEDLPEDVKGALTSVISLIKNPEIKEHLFSYINELNRNNILELEAQLKDFAQSKGIFKNKAIENLNKRISEISKILSVDLSGTTPVYTYSQYNMRAAKGEVVDININKELSLIKPAYYIEFKSNNQPRIFGIFRGIPIEFLGRKTSETSAIYTAPEIAFLKSNQKAEESLEKVIIETPDISGTVVYSGNTNNYACKNETTVASNYHILKF